MPKMPWKFEVLDNAVKVLSRRFYLLNLKAGQKALWA